jgi:hypothetical protein
VVVLAR